MRKHLENIYGKLHTNGRVETIIVAQRLGLLSTATVQERAGPAALHLPRAEIIGAAKGAR